MLQKEYIVELVTENKIKARDPTGEVIMKDLLAKKGYDMVTNVRSGQYLRISIKSKNEQEAKETIIKMCNELRIFNPVTQNLNVLNVKKKN